MKRILATIVLLLLAAATTSVALTPCWHMFGHLRHARSFHNALPIGRARVLVLGGLEYFGTQAQLPSATKSCEIIDVLHLSVREAAPMHEPRAEFVALTAPNGNIVAVSGLAGLQQYGALAGSVEMYDVASNTWHTLGNLLEARRQHAAAFINDHEILVVGGLHQDHSSMRSSEIFDINTGHSRSAAPFPFAFDCASMEHAANGDIVVLGGREQGANSYREKSVYRYDIQKDRWDLLATIAEPIQATNMLKLWDGRLLITGGSRSEIPLDFTRDVQIESEGQWRTIGRMQTERQWSASAQWSDELVIAGGGYNDNQTMLSSTDWINFERSTVEPGPSLNIARSWFPMVSVPLWRESKSEFMVMATLAIGGRTGWDQGTNTIEILLGITLNDIEKVRDRFVDARVSAAHTPVIMDAANELPHISVDGGLQMTQPYPNPTRGRTTFSLTTDHSARVLVGVFDASGNEVLRLADRPVDAGTYAFDWNTGQSPSGTYYIRAVVDSEIRTLAVHVER